MRKIRGYVCIMDDEYFVVRIFPIALNNMNMKKAQNAYSCLDSVYFHPTAIKII